MDPASLALATLPLIGGSVGAYKATRSKLRVFRHYSRDVKRLRHRFELQRVFFLNEIELLLRDVLKDEAIAKRMVEAQDQSRWDNISLEANIREHMGRSLESFHSVMEEIGSTMGKLKEGLDCFSQLEVEKHEDETLKDTVKRLRQRIKIPFNKDNFDAWTGELHRSNEDLKRLREQSHDLKPGSRCAVEALYTNQTRLTYQVPCFGSIRKASLALYGALSSAWSRSSGRRLQHSIRLFLDAEGVGEVCMNLAILCYGHQMMHGVPIMHPDLIRLQVRSRSLKSLSWTLPTGLLTPADSTASNDSGHSENGHRQKRQKVRFASPPSDSQDETGARPPAGLPHPLPSSSTKDLSKTDDICMEFTHGISSTQTQRFVSSCLGHIDDCCLDENFRHSFYPPSDGWFDPDQCRTKINPQELMRMDNILDQPIDKRLTVVHQLRLARQIASAAIKFNSTPWLDEYWSVRDLYFFHEDQGQDLSVSLQTLHLRRDVIDKEHSKAADIDVPMSPTSGPTLIRDAMRKHGIRNMTLYSLGVVLLTIGQWTRVDPDDVEEVRRLADEPCRLGPRYGELTQKLLECDFGYGKDLARPRLQEAVYENVALELELMIERLDLGR